ncbi:glycosyltransferase family 2 protein [Candidatus Moduliflexota bacterium]
MNVSIVVPVYNSQESLEELTRRIETVLAREASGHEILLIDDGSADHSWEKICELAATNSRVHGFRLMRNYGQQNALLMGIRRAKGDVIVTLDDDLQNPPEEIPKLLAKLAEGNQVVYGTPEKGRHGPFRDLASFVMKLVLRAVVGAKQAKYASAFRAFRREVRYSFDHFQGAQVCIDALLTWGATRFASVTVRHEKRRQGRSNYTLGCLTAHALNMLMGYSTKPLRLASAAGMFFAFFGIATLAYVLLRYLLEGGSVPGFPFLASTIAIFSGVQLFALGIIGEYLSRMYLRSMAKPPYTLLEQTDPIPLSDRGEAAPPTMLMEKA